MSSRQHLLPDIPKLTRRKRTFYSYARTDAEHSASVPKNVPEDKDGILKGFLPDFPRRKRHTCYKDEGNGEDEGEEDGDDDDKEGDEEQKGRKRYNMRFVVRRMSTEDESEGEDEGNGKDEVDGEDEDTGEDDVEAENEGNGEDGDGDKEGDEKQEGRKRYDLRNRSVVWGMSTEEKNEQQKPNSPRRVLHQGMGRRLGKGVRKGRSRPHKRHCFRRTEDSFLVDEWDQGPAFPWARGGNRSRPPWLFGGLDTYGSNSLGLNAGASGWGHQSDGLVAFTSGAQAAGPSSKGGADIQPLQINENINFDDI